MLLGNPPRTLARRKCARRCIALRLEHRYTKREILALYLNLAPYGEQTIGIARASRALLRLRAGGAHDRAGGVSGVAAAAAVRRRAAR